MKFPPRRVYLLLLPLLATPGSTPHVTAQATKATKKPTPSPSTLSFRVMARVSVKETNGRASSPEQMVDAKVYASGNRVRLESKLGGAPIVFLYTPPYAYKLLPTSKTGLRYATGALPVAGAGANTDLQAVLRNPSNLRASIKKSGARLVEKSRLNGVPVDVYVANSFRFLNQTFKARTWLRQSDALPVRLELTSPTASVIVSWRDYQRGRVLPGHLFAVPQGYSIRAARQAAG